jgi:putative pyruvate formate lyase activating enzyme
VNPPSYVGLAESGVLGERAGAAVRLLESCEVCPRKCRVNRLAGEKGFCRTGRRAVVAAFHAHFGEEAPLVGDSGSGTIFIANCNLRCSFCQNFEISHLGEGAEVEPRQLAGMMLQLQERGCRNINFVTPSHVVPQILEALVLAAEKSLSIPLVYNSGGYDSVETLRLLEGVFDIYMPDFKFWDNRWPLRFCDAGDYRETAAAAVEEMHRQVGDLLLSPEGTAVRGLLVRHLVMPGGIAGTEQIVRFLADRISRNTYVNIMNQYRPCGMAWKDPALDRRITEKEYGEAVAAALRAGLTRLDGIVLRGSG